MRVFYDTNILIYAISNDPREAAKRARAETLVSEAGWVCSAQVLQEFYVNAIAPKRGLPASMTPIQAAEWVAIVAADHECAALDAELVVAAAAIQRRYLIRYWDAAILAAARRMKIKRLLSEDFTHGQNYDGVTVVNPFIAEFSER